MKEHSVIRQRFIMMPLIFYFRYPEGVGQFLEVHELKQGREPVREAQQPDKVPSGREIQLFRAVL